MGSRPCRQSIHADRCAGYGKRLDRARRGSGLCSADLLGHWAFDEGAGRDATEEHRARA